MKNTEFLVQFISSLSMLSMFTYIPYWGQIIGLTLPEIAMVAFFYGISILLTNILVGRASDLVGVRKPFILAGLLITSFSIFFFIFPTNFFEFSITRIVTGIGFGMYIPTLTALVTDKKLKLGKFSGVGTAAWAVGVVISGVIGIFWVPGIFIFSSLVVAGSFFIALLIKEEKNDVKKYEYSTLQVFWQRKRHFISFIVRHSLANGIWTLWPIYLTSLGADEFSIALIQVLNPITSSIIMSRITDKIDSKLMFNFGLFFSGLTFFAYLLAPNWFYILPAQIILGLSWAFIYVGVLRYAIESTDFDKSTISGWVNSIQSISVIIGSFFAVAVLILGGTIVDIIVYASLGSLLMFVINFVIDFKANKLKVLTTEGVVVEAD